MRVLQAKADRYVSKIAFQDFLVPLNARINPVSLSASYGAIIILSYVQPDDITVYVGTIKESILFPETLLLFTGLGSIETNTSWENEDYDRFIIGAYEFSANYTLPSMVRNKPNISLTVYVVDVWILEFGMWEDIGIWMDNKNWNDG
jgi:hypothetical protein